MLRAHLNAATEPGHFIKERMSAVLDNKRGLGAVYDEDRRSAGRSPSLPNRTGRSPASGFPVGSHRWAGLGECPEMFGGNPPAALSLRTRSPYYGRPTASRRASAKRFSAAPTRPALR